jgi:hypothetical protein
MARQGHSPRPSFTAKVLLLFLPEKQGYCGTNIEIPVMKTEQKMKIIPRLEGWVKHRVAPCGYHQN